MGEFKRNLSLIKGLLFPANCFKCKKQLEWFSMKKLIDNKFICSSCLEVSKPENKRIIGELVEKYLLKKDDVFKGKIKSLYENISVVGLDENSLDKARERTRAALSNLKKKKITEDVNGIIAQTSLFETWLIFLEDLEKIHKLLKSKNIEVDYLTILYMFVEFINNEYNKVTEEGVEGIAGGLYKVIDGLGGENITKENIIRIAKEVISSKISDRDLFMNIICRCLERLHLAYTQEEVKELIEKIEEKIKLEDFEESLGVPQSINLGDFKHLDGHEFEGYIQKLFELLNYTVIRTPLTGDQGADLIISKEAVKTVVQVKKYEGSISNKAIQEAVAAKNYYKADNAMVVTNSSFTKGAIDLALANNVELWDDRKLEGIINDLNKPYKKSKVIAAIDYEKEGLELFRDEKLEEAILNYDKAIEIFPDFVEALFNRGLAYLKKGETDKAIADFSRAIEAGSSYSEIHDIYFYRGFALAGKGDNEQAMLDFNKSLGLKSEYPEVYRVFAKRGEIRVRLENSDKAIEDFNIAIEKNPNFAEVYVNRAVCYFKKKEYDKAWQDVCKAQELGLNVNPKFIEELKKVSGRYS